MKRNGMKGALCGGASLLALVCASTANAQTKSFVIPSEDGGRAVSELAQQAGIQIVAPGLALHGITTPALNGAYDVRTALGVLLKGTNIQIASDDGQTIVLAAKPKNAEAASEGAASSSNSGPAAIEEVIVTAEKRQERALDVPVSLSVISTDEILKRGVSTLEDMKYAVPGLNIVDYGPGEERVELRGVSAQLGSPTVGEYIDEVPITFLGAGGGLDVRLIDMDRVEILRGPQPTLYGEDSMGGTIRYVTASPDLSKFGAHIEGEAGGISGGGAEGKVNGWINVPLISDQLGLRLSAGHENTGGWIDALNTGAKDVNGAQIDTLRGKVLYKPTDRLTVSLLGLYQNLQQNYQNFSLSNQTTGALLPQSNDRHYTLANLVVSYDFGPVTLFSTSSYLDTAGRTQYDQTAYTEAFESLYSVTYPPNEGIGVESIGAESKKNEELRLASNGNGPLSYLVGAEYTFDKSSGSDVDVATPYPDVFGLWDAPESSAESKSWAVFGNIKYEFTPDFSASIGGRYFSDHRSDSAAQSGTFDTFNPRLDLIYKTSDAGMVYFNAAKGFRSGGFNAPFYIVNFGAPPTYAPEKLYSYELGAKQEILDRRLTVQAAVYYNNWSNIQAISPIVVGEVFTNSGRASGPGVDASLTARLMEGLTVSATIGYTGTQYNADSADRHKGDPLDLTPTWNGSLSADYRRPLFPNSDMFVHADYGYSSPVEVVLRNFPPLPGFPTSPVNKSDSHNTINARIGWENEHYQAYVFVDNLLNDYGTTYPVAGTITEPIRPRPRVVGIGLSASVD